MTFKTNLPVASCTALAGFSVLRVEGPDAAAFLQAQTMNDVAVLDVGHWHWNGLLTPKGRVLALFALLRTGDDAFLLVLPDYPAEELLPVLQRFVFRSKARLGVATDRVAAAGPAAGLPDHGHWAAGPGDEIGLDAGPGRGQRALWLLPPGHPALAASRAGTDQAWAAADLAQGFPRLPASQREAWTPQMLSLERFAAYSLRKGCYPGQEIVARTHYLGAAKRGLVRLRGTGSPEPGQAVADPSGRTVGTVVSGVASAEGSEVLAVVATEAIGTALRTGSSDLAWLPFDPAPGQPAATPE